MKRVITLLALTAAAVVLSSCNITITPPGPPANTIDVTASVSPNTSTSVVLNPGQSQVFRVSVPAGPAGSDLIYVELDRNIELEVRGSSYTSVIFSSNSAAWFSSGRLGIQSLAADAVVGQSVSTLTACRGSCVLATPASLGSTFYAAVRNDTNVTTTAKLYVYGDSYRDLTEPQNNATATAPSLAAFDSGAIETVGDIDLWWASTTGIVRFDTAVGGPALEATLLDASGVPISSQLGGGPFLNGQTFSVFAGEFIRVRASSATRAAAAARSVYYLEYQ